MENEGSVQNLSKIVQLLPILKLIQNTISKRKKIREEKFFFLQVNFSNKSAHDVLARMLLTGQIVRSIAK